MESIGLILGIYTIRGLVVFANFWIVFEKFFDYQKKKWKNSNWIWIAVYAAITYAYRPMINYGPRAVYFVMIFLYFMRVIPFLWAKYGFKPSFIITVPFYENLIDCVAQNIKFLFIISNRMNITGYQRIDADIAVTIAELLVLVFLIVLSFLKRINIARVCFTELTVLEYFLLFVTCMTYGVLEVRVFKIPGAVDSLKKMCVIIFVFILIVIMHVIMVREQNISMNTMIGNLKEPMKQITESYIEMNDKNTELRRFRHDTKNLLLALASLIKEEKYDQATEYIDKMQETMDTTKVKMFDTGNFIADALLESKAKTAAQYGIKMTIEGNIPANKIEDVNLVILISNLLDNAIEAAKQVDGERKIEIQSILKKSIWILSVKNSCVKDVVIRDNRIETTKDNKEAHGFGLSNIERVTQKYAGKLQLSCENQVFTARATLMLTA
ncbi:sensor histidine kinase [Butyrivibrio sp. INlla21]|uniref:sensor histidine kinase n=1 Tax=Butyrivibrio sp. INlla21 TaxID=1520811 RepID=UPI0008E857AC|nr:GHKL domain-containing protein [Butyrivibrio sp. INlla21]SFU96393.1 GHKL domain-containing protein [Butyrivibrio sp. INlla21]